MNETDIISRLPGDLKRVAEVIGVDNALALVSTFGGSYLIVPKCDGLVKEIRDNEIRSLYDGGEYTVRDLAWKFKLSDRQIQTILSKTGKEVPLPLLELIASKKS